MIPAWTPKQQYISRLSKTRMYKTVWQTKEETSARLHSPKSTHVNPEQAQQGYYQMTPDYLLKLAPGDCSPFRAQQSPNVCSLQRLPAAFLRLAREQYISRLSKTCMYKTAWQTKEKTVARDTTSYTATQHSEMRARRYGGSHKQSKTWLLQ